MAVNLLQRKTPPFHERFVSNLPDRPLVESLLLITWATATGTADALLAPVEKIRSLIAATEQSSGDENSQRSQIFATCKEALEVLSVMFALSPELLVDLAQDVRFKSFVVDLLLISPEPLIRATALEHLALIATKCTVGHEFLVKFIDLLYEQLTVLVSEHYAKSRDFFQLFCRLLNAANVTRCTLPLAPQLLNLEIDLIRNVKVSDW